MVSTALGLYNNDVGTISHRRVAVEGSMSREPGDR